MKNVTNTTGMTGTTSDTNRASSRALASRSTHALGVLALFCTAGIAAADPASNAFIRSTGTGFTGTGVRIGVIESGNGNPELSPANANMPVAGPAAGQNGRTTIIANPFNPGAAVLTDHATTVVGTIQGPAGVASNSTLFETHNSTVSDLIQIGQRLFQPVAAGGKNVQIMNLSLHAFTPPANGNSTLTRWGDWSSITSAQTQPYRNKLVVIAGNENAPNTRQQPWDNYNGITVAALGGHTSRTLATYNGAAGTRNRTTDGRFKTDISAPGGGDGVALMAPVVKGGVNDVAHRGANDGLNSDHLQWGGTSFATPMVTGAAAQLYQANGGDMDHKAAKALLLNGADTRVRHHDATRAGGAAWRPEGNQGNKAGGQQIRVGWDGDIGTGVLDVQASVDNWRAGNQNAGNVRPVGWNVGFMNATGTSNDYVLTMPNPNDYVVNITATMCWDRRIELTTDTNSDGLWQPGDAFTSQAFNDFDLEIWNLTLNQKLAWSTSDRDSIEHVRNFLLPNNMRGDRIAIRTVDFAHNDAGIIQYGLAWRATILPTPGGVALFLIGSFATVRRRRTA
jgi:hypothetical protein